MGASGSPRGAEPSETGGPGLPPALEHNIKALMRRRSEDMRAAPATERIAAAVTNFLGSVWSLVLHASAFGAWILLNLGVLPAVAPWDPTFVVLGMIASVEAIFLTTFVLINQNRLARVEEERNELSLQVALLSERQSSALLALVGALAERMGVESPGASENIAQLTVATEPAAVVEEIRRQKPDAL